MHHLSLVTFLITTISAASIPPSRSSTRTVDAQLPINEALFDGECFYPKPTANFDTTSYLGRWHQVAGYFFGPSAGVRCSFAEYSLNDNGTIRVVNGGKRGDRNSSITGFAAAAPESYGKAGVFKVEFPGQSRPAVCEGPNYIVQEFSSEFSIVQTYNWTTLFILSRERNPGQVKIDQWIGKAVSLGSNSSRIIPFDQTGC
ncbi:Calycin-like protein [Byssothecium circinans]|uniref:Calycin-like protein n=1 Tax=Byssothecium circinans TaxID=147558 RepID=A0A6A5TGS6_9PLEO|nr:Calycin-like protein [Byssothecium circinans]